MAQPLKPLEPREPPPHAPAHEGLRARIETLLNRVSITIVNTYQNVAVNVLAWGFQTFAEAFEHAMTEEYGEWIDWILEHPDLPERYKAMFRKAKAGESQAATTLLTGMATSAGSSAVGGLFAPFSRLLNYMIEMVVRTARPGPAEAWAMIRRDRNLEGFLKSGLAELGWSVRHIDLWDTITQPILSEADLTRLFYLYPGFRDNIRNELSERGWTDDRIRRLLLVAAPVHDVGSLMALWRLNPDRRGEIEAELSDRGWLTGAIGDLTQLAEYRPTVQDLIRFAVREVYTPSVAERFGLYDEFPGEFASEANLLGLREDYAQQFWAAHWALPSIRDGFEMFHRLRPGRSDTPFTYEDLSTLIKAHDISPYWRDRLIALSYNLPTRVDLRRFYVAGLVDENYVYNTYLDLGNSPELAELLTQFAIYDRYQSQRDRTKTTTLKGYKKGLINRQEAFDGLVDIGVLPEDAELELTLADLDIAEARTDETLERVEYLFVNRQIEVNDAWGELGRLNLTNDQITNLIDVWSVRRLKNVTLPTRTDWRDWYKRDIITRDEWRAGMIQAGILSEHVDNYLQEIEQEIAEERQKELNKAQEEEERLARAVKANDYQKQKAALDVRIAEIRVEIADLKVSLHAIVGETEIEVIKTDIDELKADIADIQAQKAKLRRAEFEI